MPSGLMDDEAQKKETVYPSTKARMDAAVRYATKEGIRGALLGFSISMAASLALQRISPLYRSIILPGKTILVSVVTLGTAVVVSENAIYHFNRPFLSQPVLGPVKPATWRDCLWYHRYEVLAAIIGGSLITSLVIVDRRYPHLTATQKFLNARLWAQAAGLGAAVGAVALLGDRGESEASRKDE